MTNIPSVAVTAQDLLAAIGFEARRITAAIDNHAIGYPCPPAVELCKAIAHMAELADILSAADVGVTSASSAQVIGSSGMKVELN